jgi:4,5-dihydroxyphthalate decarboxylase
LESARASHPAWRPLEGRKVGVNRGYTVIIGLWARGVLQSEYGVDLNRITWIPTDDEHVLGFKEPANADYRFRGAKMVDLLMAGEIEAAIGEVAVDAPETKPLFPDARNEALGYFRRTGIYPINHGVVVKDTVLKEMPWIAGELYRAFEKSKTEYLKNLDLGDAATSWDRRQGERGGGRRSVSVRHRAEPDGTGGDDAVRGGPEDGAAQICG